MLSTARITQIENQSDKKSIGIYWGTFDPPTLAHANIIETSIEQFNLSKIIVVINDDTKTGKTYKSPGKMRLAMLLSMISDSQKDKISIVRQTDNFSVSYKDVKSIYADEYIFAIVGQDSFEKYGKYCADYDQVIVAPRDGTTAELQRKIDSFNLKNAVILNTDKRFLNTSSTMVRDAVNAKQNDVVITHTAPSIQQYIQNHGLFSGNYTAGHYQSAVLIQRCWRSKSQRTLVEASEHVSGGNRCSKAALSI